MPPRSSRRHHQCVRRRPLHRLEARGLACAYVPEDVAKFFPAEHRDPDGLYASSRIYVVSLAYNTGMVKRRRAQGLHGSPAFEWMNRLVKAHPSYSGTIMTSTPDRADLGWDYFEKLARHKVMQVQSSSIRRTRSRSRTRRLADATTSRHPAKERGRPIEMSIPEGAPLIVCPNAVLKTRPIPTRRGCSRATFLGRRPAGAVRFCRPAFRAPAVRRSPGAGRLPRSMS